MSGFDPLRYQIFWEVVGLERGPFSLVSTVEELFEKKCSRTGLEIREYCRGDPSLWPRDTLYPQKLALTSPTSGGRSVGIVGSRTEATEFSFYYGLEEGNFPVRCSYWPGPACIPSLSVDFNVHVPCSHSNSVLTALTYTLKVEAVYSSETVSRSRRPQCVANHGTDDTACKSLLVFVGVMKRDTK
jgi:hypothetical protein